MVGLRGLGHWTGLVFQLQRRLRKPAPGASTPSSTRCLCATVLPTPAPCASVRICMQYRFVDVCPSCVHLLRAGRVFIEKWGETCGLFLGSVWGLFWLVAWPGTIAQDPPPCLCTRHTSQHMSCTSLRICLVVCLPAWQAPKGPPEESTSALERWYADFRRGLLGVLFVMANDTAHAPKQWKSWFIVVFHMLQVGKPRGHSDVFRCSGAGQGGAAPRAGAVWCGQRQPLVGFRVSRAR